jgi:hydroxymethylglutaryl-CoA lyase
MANVYAGLEAGVRIIDCSVGGMGGCPFAKGAAGNVPTEDVAFMCQELGIQTGVSLQKLCAAARYAESVVGAPLPGKLYKTIDRVP